MDEHAVFDGEASWRHDGEASWRHDVGGGVRRLEAKESEAWKSDEGSSRKRELQVGDEQENIETTAYLSLREARSRYCIEEEFFELVGGNKQQPSLWRRLAASGY